MSKPTLVVLSIFVGLLGYTIALAPLNLALSTDYPRQPGDGYRALVKVIVAGLVGWLCAQIGTGISPVRNREIGGPVYSTVLYRDRQAPLPCELGRIRHNSHSLLSHRFKNLCHPCSGTMFLDAYFVAGTMKSWVVFFLGKSTLVE